MLAIVVPYYKINFFEATLDSLANQTNKQFKVYIGDDASPDNPKNVLEEYKNKLELVYQRFETNLGGISLVQQWERCLIMLQDEKWVMILGDDDVLESNCIEAFYANLSQIENLDITVVRFATQVVNEKGTAISKVYKHPKTESTTDFLMRKLKGGTRSSLSEYVFKRELINSIQFKDLPLAWYSDLLAVLEFSKWKQIFTINEALVYFRLSGFNITSKKDDLALKNVATFNFFYYLLKEKKFIFNNEQRKVLYFKLEKAFLDNKKNVKFWKQLTRLYIVDLQIYRYFNFIMKATNSILKIDR